MTRPSLTDPRQDGRSQAFRWCLLFAVSALIALPLELLHLPAALLLGPMAAGIVIALKAGAVHVPRPLFAIAQSLVGCLMARAITPDILSTMHDDWPLFLLLILAVITVSALLGWLLARWQVLPGTSAIWGSSPGAASAMVILADAHGADARLVAFMQYLRVVFVAVATSIVAGIWTGASTSAPAQAVLLAPVDWPAFAQTLCVVAAGVLAWRLRLPGGPMLTPLALGSIGNITGLLKIELPPLLLIGCYAVLGWTIGLRFTPAILRHAVRALPQVAASIVTLMIVCAGFAAILVHYAGIDPLTAYLATSPGGADTVAIIAASTNVDVPFVMAMQTGRFLIVLFTGPTLARFMAARAGRPDDGPA